MHLLSRFGQKSPSFFFCNIFFAVENTLSDGAVDAGITKYFLASLEISEKMFRDISTTSKDHLCDSLFPPPSDTSASHHLSSSIKSMNRFLYIGLASFFDIAIVMFINVYL